VETEFWNMDALFMPQFHPARDIHDVYFVKEPTHASSIEEPFLSRVAQAHQQGGETGSTGWNYLFNAERACRWSYGARGLLSRPAHWRLNRMCRESIFPSPGVFATIRWMRLTQPISSR